MNAYDDDPGAGPSRLDQVRAELRDTTMLDDLPDPEPLIDGVLYRDSLAWLHGKPGHAKSFVALDWAACVSLGLPWHDCGTIKGPVLYVIGEGVTGLRQRVRAWEDNAGEPVAITFLPVAMQMLSPIDVNVTIILATEIKPILIVVDTQARATVGADENSAKDMGQLVAAVDRIRYASRACVLLVHHESRNGESLRGSTALEGAATTLIRVTKDGASVRLDNTKQKDAIAFEPIRLRLAPRLASAVLVARDGVGLNDESTDSERRLIDAMRDQVGTDGMAWSNLKDIAPIPKSSFNRALKSLLRRGDIRNVGSDKRPRYALASDLVPSSPIKSHEVSQEAGPQVPRSHHPVGVGPTGTTRAETETLPVDDDEPGPGNNYGMP